MPKATWNGTVLAESDNTVVVEGNHYFPAAALKMEHFKPSAKTTVCGWKGTASYYTVCVDGKENADPRGTIRPRRTRPRRSPGTSPSGKA